MDSKTERRSKIFQAARNYGEDCKAIGQNPRGEAEAKRADAAFQVFLKELDSLLSNSKPKKSV